MADSADPLPGADGGLIRMALDAHPAATLLIDAEGRVILMNAAARTRFAQRQGARPTFAQLWDTPAEASLAQLQGLLASTNWMPMQLVPCQQRESDPRPDLRGRGLRMGDRMVAMVTLDADRDHALAAQRSHLAQLNAQIEAHRLTEARLTRSVDRGHRLHRELVHRVKNNLAVLSALVRGQVRAAADPAASRALEAMRARIRALGVVHDVLDRDEQVDYVQASALVAGLVENARGDITGDASIVTDLPPTDFHLDVIQATPLALIVIDSLRSALDHAFPSGQPGTILVKLTFANGIVDLVIADDGIGADTGDLDRGNGAPIAQALASQLGGTLTRTPRTDAPPQGDPASAGGPGPELSSAPPGTTGTSWHLQFPLGSPRPDFFAKEYP